MSKKKRKSKKYYNPYKEKRIMADYERVVKAAFDRWYNEK